MAWACMAANGADSPVFINVVTADKNGKMDFEVYKSIRSTHFWPTATKLIALQRADG